MMSGGGLCNRDDESPMLHTFQADQTSSELLHLSSFAMDNEDFQAGIVIEMCVTGRNDQFVMGVLKFGELLGNSVSVVVIDERDGADHRRTRTCRLLGNQPIANQIAEGLGPIRIPEAGDEMVEALEEVRIECHSDSAENAHVHSSEESSISQLKKRSTNIEFVHLDSFIVQRRI